MKRLLSLSFCIFILLAVFSACGKGEETSSTGSVTADNGIFSTEDVLFADGGESRYLIIRPENCESSITQAASLVYGSIKKATSTNPKNTSDDSDGTDAYEILVGETNRPETATAKQYLLENVGGRIGDYIICTIGKKIVILGINDDATVAAANYFVDNYVKNEAIAGGIVYTYATQGDFKDITIAGNDISKYDIVRPHYNSSYITQIEIEELQSYLVNATGYSVDILEDRYVDEGEYEIVIGDTNRSGVTEIDNYDEYIIKVEGNKVYINGGSYHATAIAVSEFNKMLEAGNITEANNVDGSYEATIAGYDKTTQFTPTWYDEFDGNTVDETKWNFYGPGQSDSAGCDGRLAIRSRDPNVCYVKDGQFTIAASYDDKYYYGGMLRGNGKMDFRYGFAEISCLMPDGDGFWIAFWSCSDEPGRLLSPEIDITEMFGNAAVTAANCHTWPTHLGKELGYEEHYSLDGKYSNEKRRTMLTNEKDDAHFGLDFHTFGMLWDNTQMTFTCDGEIYFSYDITQDPADVETFNHTMYLIVSMAVGFESCGLQVTNATQYEWQETNKFITDSVYVYQLYDGLHELNGVKLN